MITEDIQSNYNSSKMLKYNNKSISKNTLISNNNADIVSDKNEKNERSDYLENKGGQDGIDLVDYIV